MIPRLNSARQAVDGKRAVLGLFAVILLASAILYVEVLFLGGEMSEGSLVQIAQAFMILLSAVFFALGVRRFPDKRGYLVAVSTLFFCMFIRENDGLLDQIRHGFWAVPAFLAAAVGGVAVWTYRTTLTGPLFSHAASGSFWIVMVGFLQLLVFSRLFGSHLLWNHVLTEDAAGIAKTIVQEGTELVSYSLIVLGSLLSLRAHFAPMPPTALSD